MGAHLVAEVLARWTDVSDRAFRILVRMAVTALDKPQNGQPACIYRGGRELLAMSLRSEKGSARTRNRAVAKAVAELTELGAIEHLVTGWAGQNAVYRLTLSRTRLIVKDRSNSKGVGGLKDHPVDGSTDHPMDGPSGAERVVSETTPRNQEELPEERGEEESVDLRTDVTVARAREAEPTEPDSPSTRPKKCPHGLSAALRPDGLPSCALCRREARPPGPPEPNPPPPGRPRCRHGLTVGPESNQCTACLADDRMAPVIDLHARRTA